MCTKIISISKIRRIPLQQYIPVLIFVNKTKRRSGCNGRILFLQRNYFRSQTAAGLHLASRHHHSNFRSQKMLLVHRDLWSSWISTGISNNFSIQTNPLSVPWLVLTAIAIFPIILFIDEKSHSSYLRSSRVFRG